MRRSAAANAVFGSTLGLRCTVPQTHSAPPLAAEPEDTDAEAEAEAAAMVIRFCVWAHALAKFPTSIKTQRRFSVTRTTADGWRRALADAYGYDLADDDQDDA